MSVDVQQKMLEMMQSKKNFLKKYKRAKQLFNDMVKKQKQLLKGTSREKKMTKRRARSMLEKAFTP
jgi:CHASE3 domain sensor protein